VLLSVVLAPLALSCIPVPPAVTLPGPVVEPFVMPSCRRCAGHRGVTVSVPAGLPVRAGHGGTVTFDGSVAGRRFVVIRTGEGLLLTYGDVVPSGGRLAQGAEVGPRAVIGASAGRVYVGVRQGGLPVHPRALFAGKGSRLVPPTGLRCPARPPGPL
jgi:hypothetical protein